MKKIFLTVVLSLFLVAVGAYGCFLYIQKNTLPEARKITELIRSNSLDVISVTMNGTVAELSSDKIVLNKDGRLLKLNIPKDVRVYKSFNVDKLEAIQLSDIGVSDQVSVYVRIGSEGDLSVQNIIILEKK